MWLIDLFNVLMFIYDLKEIFLLIPCISNLPAIGLKFSDKDAMEQIPLEAFRLQLYQREREITSGCNLNSIWIWVAIDANHSLEKSDESIIALFYFLFFYTCSDTSLWIIQGKMHLKWFFKLTFTVYCDNLKSISYWLHFCLGHGFSAGINLMWGTTLK